MKTIINILRLSAACAASLLMLASCDTDVESIDINQPSIESQNPELYKQYLGKLKAYKQSAHKIMFAGFDNSNKLPYTQAQHINAVPDSVDYVILSNPEAINEREIKEMNEIREQKGTKSVYVVSFDDIKQQYIDEKADYDAQKAEEAAEFVDFKTYLADSVTSRLSYCNRFGFDGVIMAFKGKETITMTELEKAEYVANSTLFLGIAKDWAERNAGKELMLQGKPQFYLDQTIFEHAKYILTPCQDVSSAYGVLSVVQKACAEGVPTDRFVPVVETMSMDSSDKVTGWWSGNVPASLGAAQVAAAFYLDYTIAGLAIMNINNDYYNSKFVYPRIRTAISLMNTPVKN